VLDLKRDKPRAALRRLIGQADVVVHNMRQGAAERLGLDYGSLAAQDPRIILAWASGFRKGSSLKDSPAYDDLIQGLTGTASLNAGPDGTPRYFPTVIADKVSGHMLASMIGMALFHRERTGQGQEVHVPMVETMLHFMLVEHMWGATIGEPAQGMGYPRMLTPHRRPYRTKDGFISVIAVDDRQWRRIFEAMGRPELMDDPRFASIGARSENADVVYATLTEGMPSRTTAEWLAILQAADIPCGEAGTLPDLLDNPYLRETGFFQDFEHPANGHTVLVAVPAMFSASPPAIRRLPPSLGEHTAEILRDAGYADAEIAEITGA